MIDYEQHVILKNKGSMNLHQLNKKGKNSLTKYGKKFVDLETLVGKTYGTYKLIARTSQSKPVYDLELCDLKVSMKDELLKEFSSGENNQEIWDDGTSQQLKKEDIDKLQEQGLSGTEIISQLAENNKSFKARTEFSQEKYVNKKEKKYSEFVEVLRPSVRLVARLLYDANPQKNYLRPDSLALMLTTANVMTGGKFAVYEDINQGLLTAAVLDRLQGNGKVFSFQSKGPALKLAVNAMNFTNEQLAPLKAVNIEQLKSLLAEPEASNGDETPAKKLKLDAAGSDSSLELQSLDGMLIASRRPLLAALSLMKLMTPSKGFAVICPFIEPLVETYTQLRERSLAANLKLTENWMRYYQVLPSRTHPEVNMSGSSGYVLSGITVASE